MKQSNNKSSNCCRRRSTIERCLMLATIVAFARVSGLTVCSAAVLPSGRIIEDIIAPPDLLQDLDDYDSTAPSENQVIDANKKPNVCLTSECNRTALNVKSRMNFEVEPCDDFYEFACGKLNKETEIPEGSVKVNMFSEITQKIDKELQNIISEERSITDPKHLRLPNQLYKACMNTELIESLGSKPMQTISESLGGWPVVKGANWDAENTWTWPATISKFRHLGFGMDYIIEFRWFGVPTFGLMGWQLVRGLNDTVVNAYYDYMVDVAVLFGADREAARTELKQSLQFEIDLAKISARQQIINSFNLTTLSIKEAQKRYPYIEWLDYVNSLLDGRIKVNETQILNIDNAGFFEKLGDLLANTDKRVICNYLMWRIHDYSTMYLSKKFRDRGMQFDALLSGRQTSQTLIQREGDCAQEILKRYKKHEQLSYHPSLQFLYVRKYVKEGTRGNVSEMVNNIKNVYDELLSSAHWMDSDTMQKAKQKLHGMKDYIAYQEELFDSEKLTEYYKELSVDTDKYFESVLQQNAFFLNQKQRIDLLRFNNSLAYVTPSDIEPKYYPIHNFIKLPAGILQGHCFNADRPKFMNYGSCGYFIGHEITHGFDNNGRRFDVNGKLRNWWQPNAEKEFSSKAKCFIEQYGNFTDEIAGLKVNGEQTLGENIADNGGAKASYLAYKRWSKENGEELRLPGLDYTPEQLFWISTAQTWCSKSTKQMRVHYIKTDAHAPEEFRVLGTLRNMDDFSKDFQCPVGSPMNPVHKCQLW